MKRIVIAGSRKYNNYAEAKEYIDMCISGLNKDNTIVFVSGGCKGADKLGERYAEENGIQIERYCAEWSKYGKGAGPIRNRKMADICDIVICFWDGQSSGTGSMIECAKKAGKRVYIKRICTAKE